MMNPFEKPKKRSLATLQLAPLIDIFVLIIVFLVKGTVLGGSTLELPVDFDPAKSRSSENLEIAPEVYITKEKIIFKFINQELVLTDFENAQFENSQISSQIKNYIDQLPDKQKQLGLFTNLVADKGLSYKWVFEVTKFLRVSGFQQILYVAEGEK